jgi:hypothetical protein
MKTVCVVLVLTIAGMAASGNAPKRIKIATVPDEYTPTNASVKEPVSMQDFRFDVNKETGRARIVVNYIYDDYWTYEKDDDNGGPRPTIVQIPGLKYLPQAHMVVYDADGKRTVCADVQERKGRLGARIHIKNTGLCTVTAERTKHAEDDGWKIRRSSAIDTFLVIR